MKILKNLCGRIYPILILLLFFTTSCKQKMSKVTVSAKETMVNIDNHLVGVSFNLSKGNYSAVNKTNEKECISEAFFTLNEFVSTANYTYTWTSAEVNDELGAGKKVVFTGKQNGSPDLILEIILYDNKGFWVVNSGLVNTTGKELRVKKFSPLTAKAFEGFTFNNYKALDGESGGFQTHVSTADTLNCRNNLLVTFGEKGKPKSSLVIGGLTYNEFQKFASVINKKKHLDVSVSADDPVGKLVDAGATYVMNEKFYVDFTTDNRFEALESYGFALRDANHCKITGIEYPVLNLWYVQWEHGGRDENRNNTPGSVWTMEDVAKTGFLKYGPVGIRLEPDDYSYPNNQQGWWDDEHWQKYPSGGFKAPYETALKWGKAIQQLGGVPFMYVQTARRSDDYCKAFPDHILFNDPFKPRSEGGCGWWNNSKGDPWWSYDFTDPGFIEHMKEVYRNLKAAGVKGVKFDYPETGWAYDGGLEDKYATAASAYRNIYKLALEGLGDGSDVHERLPWCGDLTLGIATTYRSQGDADYLFPPFASKTGLRWYKNRVAINYDLDAKNPFNGVPFGSRDGVQAMYTMTYVTSARLEIGKYFGKMTPEQLYDLSRVVPMHTNPKSARPVDAFAGKEYPQVYDFAVNPGWHLLTFYNTKATGAKWPSRWPEWYEPLKSIPVHSEVSVHLGDATDDGGLGLDPEKNYFIWDFWNWQLVGRFSGAEELKQGLRPGEARMFAVHETKTHPQFISTSRHIMQGYIDFAKYPEWNKDRKELTGVSKVIGGEPYKVIVACNNFATTACSAEGADSNIKMIDDKNGFAELTITSSENKEVKWTVRFK